MTTARTLDPSFSCSDWNVAEGAHEGAPRFEPRNSAPRAAESSERLVILPAERLDPYDVDWLE